MATNEIPFSEVAQEFLESLDDDMKVWEKAVRERMEAYDRDQAKVAKAGHGTMICLVPPEELLPQLAMEGGEDPAELHVTVLYLGKGLTEAQLSSVAAIVEQIAATYAPLEVEVGGAGRFPATPSSDDKDVLIRLISVPRLEAFREELIAAFRGAGIEPVLNFGYTPHMTMAYVPIGAVGQCVHPDPVNFVAEGIWVATGGDWEEYPFTGEEVLKSNDLADEIVRGDVTYTAVIAKVDKDQRLVFGWVTVSDEAGSPVVDKQGDIISEEEMEKMAYNFVLDCRKAGEMHEKVGVGSLVESLVFTKEKQKALGIDLGKSAWWCGFKITDDAVWAKVKDGTYGAFSVHGRGRRDRID